MNYFKVITTQDNDVVQIQLLTLETIVSKLKLLVGLDTTKCVNAVVGAFMDSSYIIVSQQEDVYDDDGKYVETVNTTIKFTEMLHEDVINLMKDF